MSHDLFALENRKIHAYQTYGNRYAYIHTCIHFAKQTHSHTHPQTVKHSINIRTKPHAYVTPVALHLASLDPSRDNTCPSIPSNEVTQSVPPAIFQSVSLHIVAPVPESHLYPSMYIVLQHIASLKSPLSQHVLSHSQKLMITHFVHATRFPCQLSSRRILSMSWHVTPQLSSSPPTHLPHL